MVEESSFPFPFLISLCVFYLTTSVLPGRVYNAQVHVGGNSVTACFNIIEDVADIRWGRDMLHKNGCILNMGEEKREVYCTYNYNYELRENESTFFWA